MKAKRSSKKAKQLSLDIITTLPQPIIETILCLLPIKEAARTTILSREWRYKWTKIPKLDFSRPGHPWQMMESSKLLCVIHQVMSLRQDPIHEFTLCISDDKLFSKIDNVSCQLDQIIYKLSRNHAVKKLTLDFDFGYDKYDLPLSFFSLHHLTELYLGQCGLEHQPVIFNGFGSLTSLTLDDVEISMKTLLHLLSNCPSLKSFTLLLYGYHILGDKESTMIELFECLPVIEHLTIWSETCLWFVPDFVPQELPNPPIHLKYFCFTRMSFHDCYGLTFLAVLIKSSPNLEKIELKIDYFFDICDDLIADSEMYEKYHSDVWLEHLSGVWLEHLNEMKIEYFSNLEPEMEFVKLILARSPKLKKLCIKMSYKGQETEKLKSLLRGPHASAVEINVV